MIRVNAHANEMNADCKFLNSTSAALAAVDASLLLKGTSRVGCVNCNALLRI